MKKISILLLAMFTALGICSAHQPRLVRDQPNNEAHPIVVTNPEVSQAFYGILSGQPDYYQIQMDTWFLLYANIVVPDLSGQRTDFIVDIIAGKDAVYTRLDGRKFQRTRFYEEFAGDMYLKGPEREKQVPAGTYNITVSNKDNQGKYSLAIGKIESFGFSESLKTLGRLPALKITFFDKSFFAIFEGRIIQALTIGLLVLVGLILVVVRIVKGIRRRKKNSKKANKKKE